MALFLHRGRRDEEESQDQGDTDDHSHETEMKTIGTKTVFVVESLGISQRTLHAQPGEKSVLSATNLIILRVCASLERK